jgi:hypothetical protein
MSFPLNPAKGLTVVGAAWALAEPTGPPLVLREPQFLKIQTRAFNVPEERPRLHSLVAGSAKISLQSLCRECPAIETVMLS